MKYRSFINRISALALSLCCITGSLEVPAAIALDAESSGQVEWSDTKIPTLKPENCSVVVNALTVVLKHEYSDYWETIDASYFNDNRIISVIDTLSGTGAAPDTLRLDKYRKILQLELCTQTEMELDAVVAELETRNDVRNVSYVITNNNYRVESSLSYADILGTL